MEFYYKLKGYNSFFYVSGSVRKSHRGNLVFTVETHEEVSRYHYYKHAQKRFSLFRLSVGQEVHEIGNSFLPWPNK